MLDKMKIFITGSTGFIGTYLIKRLSETKHELRCLVREKSDTRFLKESDAKIFIGDITDKSTILKGMEGCDCVIHLASSFIFWASNNRVFEDVNVTGTRNIMESSLETGISKVIYISSIGVYGNAEWPITENTPVGTKCYSKYLRTKYKGDLIAWKLYEERKLPLVVIYPSGVIGANDPKACGQYIKNFALGRMPAQILTKIYFPFVHVKNVADGIVKALEKENNIGEKYILSAENITFGDFNKMISEISKTRLPFLKLPNWLSVLSSYMVTGIANIFRKPPLWDMSVDQISLMRHGMKTDGSKAERELGIKYTPIYNGIKDSIESIRG